MGNLEGKTLAVLGLSFKPQTDDMREAPAVDIINSLTGRGAHVRAYDPVAMEQAKRCLPNIEYAADEYEAVAGGGRARLILKAAYARMQSVIS